MIIINSVDSFTNIIIENSFLRIECFPELGGKIHKIYSKEKSFEFLLPSQTKKYKRAKFGDSFEDYDTSGFDECFPTVSDCIIRNEEGVEIEIPDHGEMWSSKWDYEISEEKLILQFKGEQFSYIFRKEISLNQNKLEISYFVQNYDRLEMNYIWSAHPLLNVSPDDKIILPGDVKNFFLNWTNDKSIGKYCSNVRWPFVDGKHNFSEVKEKSFGKSIKLFSEKLKKGCAGIYFKKINQSLLLEFSADDLPYLGLWICYGGWPEGNSEKHLTVAIEPTTGFPDSLAAAIQNKTAVTLKPNEFKKWKVSFSIADGEVHI